MITTAILQKGYPLYKRDRGTGLQKVYSYIIPKASVLQYIPADSSQDPNGEEGYSFLSSTTSVHEDANLLYLQLTYGATTSISTSLKPDIGSIILASSISVSERPIETHPNYVVGGTSTFMTYIADNNILTYTVASPQYTRTEVVSSRNTAFSESLAISGVNTRGAPTGLMGASSTKWVKIGRDINVDGDYMTIRDTYAYDAQGWKGVDFGLNITT